MTQDPQCVKAFRDEVALCCIKEAQRLYPQAIQFHFHTPITQVDLHRQTIHAGTAGPSATQVCCDALYFNERMYFHATKLRQTCLADPVSFSLEVAFSLGVGGGSVIACLMLQEVPYDLLVGADGAGSVVRSALQQIMPAHYLRRYSHNQVYSMMKCTPSDPEQIPSHANSQAHPTKVRLNANRYLDRLPAGHGHSRQSVYAVRASDHVYMVKPA